MSLKNVNLIKELPKLLFIGIALMAMSIFCLKVSLLQDNVDLGRHLMNGKHLFSESALLFRNVYSAYFSKEVFLNHHWFSGVLFYTVFSVFGIGGLIVVKAFFYTLALMGVGLLAWSRTRFRVMVACLIPAVIVFSSRAAIRPELITCVCLMSMIVVLTRAREQSLIRYWPLLILQVVWVNSHLYFFLGPVLWGLFCLCQYGCPKREIGVQEWRRYITVGMALVFVCLLNPNTWRGVLHPALIFLNHGYSGSDNVSPFTIPFVGNPRQALFFVWMGLCGVASVFNIKRRWMWEWSLFLLGLFLGCVAKRHVGFMVLLTFYPVCVFVMQKVWLRRLVGLLPIITVVLILSYHDFPSKRRYGLGYKNQTLSLQHFLKKTAVQTPMFNDFNTGSYLIWTMYPDLKPFVDNRSEAYPKGFFQREYLPMMASESHWQSSLRRYGFKTLILSTEGHPKFLLRRITDPRWACIYAGPYTVVFVDRGSHEGLLNLEITERNAVRRLHDLLNSDSVHSRWVGIQLLHMLGRPEFAMAYATQTAFLWPSFFWADLYLARMYESDYEHSGLATFWRERATQKD